MMPENIVRECDAVTVEHKPHTHRHALLLYKLFAERKHFIAFVSIFFVFLLSPRNFK